MNSPGINCTARSFQGERTFLAVVNDQPKVMSSLIAGQRSGQPDLLIRGWAVEYFMEGSIGKCRSSLSGAFSAPNDEIC